MSKLIFFILFIVVVTISNGNGSSLIPFALIAIGIGMAWSGFSAKVPNEYNYHILFRATWWLPLILGIILAIF